MDDDAMNNESNRTGVSPSLEKEIADVMKQLKLSREDAISYILSNEESTEAEAGDQEIINMATEPKASGGLVGKQGKLDKNKDGKISGADFKMMKKNYSYGGRVAAMSAEKS
jgi:hypothetical protein